MRDDVRTILFERYNAARHNQTRNGVTFQLTADEFIALWNPYRINKIEGFLDAENHQALNRWFRHKEHGPVCTWVSREELKSGVMHAGNAQVTTRKNSLRVCGLKRGDKHTPETIKKMTKCKAQKHRDAMSASARMRWARYRAEKER